MRILFVAPAPPPPGGIESVTESLLNYVRQHDNGYELVHYNTSHRYRPVTNETVIVRILTGIQNSVQTLFKVKSLMNTPPSLIHVASSASLSLFRDYLIVRSARRKGIPVVLHWHFGRIPDLKQKQNWEWKMLFCVARLSSMNIVIDQRSYEALSSAGILELVNIPNPLSAETTKISLNLQAANVDRVKNRLIFVGHVIKSKGVYELAEACSGLPEPPELLMVGPYEPEIRKDLELIASSRNNGNWITFTGSVSHSEVLEYMIHAPVLVLPSYTEGFPMVVIEAMAMGCAVIATDVGGIPEALAIGTTKPCGICIESRQVQPLRMAIEELFGDQDAISSFSKNGITRASTQYTMERVELQYRKIWNQILENNLSKQSSI